MLEGEVREIDLVPRLIELWRQKFTGAIRFENDGIIKIIYFKGGEVLSASTNDRTDSVDELLMRAGKVSREHVKQALARRKETETLGDALLNLGFITRKELTWARRVQVINVIRSIGEWQAGTFTIVEDYLPKREEGTVFPLPQIIVEMIVTDADRQKYERVMESGSAVFEKAPSFEHQFRELGLNEDADAIVKEVDGARTASEVAASSGQETFNVYKLLHALTHLGLLHQRSSVPADAVAAPPGFGDVEVAADGADVWSAPPAPQFSFEDEPPPDPPVVAPIAAAESEPPAEAAEEPSWGFDEAQVEASRKATAPAAAAAAPARALRPQLAPRKKAQSRRGLAIALVALLALAGGGYAAFIWWNGRGTAPEVVAPAETRPVVTQTAPPALIQNPVPVPVPEPAPVTQTATAEPASPSPAAPSPSRYEAMAREFARNPAGKFTVQFAIVCEPSNVTKALSSGGSSVWFIPISLKGRSCFRMFWGRHETREAADRDLVNLPAALRESKPAVVTIPR